MIVQGRRLFKIYRMGMEGVYALNDVSLEVNRGDLLAIVGKSGCGKSTLLHIIGCLQRPTSGDVFIEGKKASSLSDREMAKVRGQKIGFVFQAFNLMPNETALANVELPLEYQGVRSQERHKRAQKALETVGLGDRLEHRPSELSGGQRQRVAIARALVYDPAIILADEPTGALDSRAGAGLMALFQRLNDDGRTIVIVTHDATIATHCPRVITMSDGKVVDDKKISRKPVPTPMNGGGAQTPADNITVCPRCNSDNAPEGEVCNNCGFPLHLTVEEEKLIRQRLSGAWPGGLLGVESTSEEAEIAWQGLLDELRKVPLFAGLGAKNLTKLLPALEERQYSQGSTIIEQGDPGDCFYILRGGLVQVILKKGGEQPVLARLAAGEVFGEMALLTGQPRSASVVAYTDVVVWRLSKETFDRLITENLSLVLYFNRVLSQRLQNTQARFPL